MTAERERAGAPPGSTRRRGAAEVLLRAWNVLVFAAWIALPFAAAGTARWWPGWAHLSALAAGLLAQAAFVRARSPALRARRRTIGAGAKRWDLAWNALFWPLMASMAVAAGAEFRRAGTTLPGWTFVAGAAILAAGLAVSARSMAANPWFEGAVRVAPGEGQRVVDAGPYRRVRHPGYLGLVLWAAATPFLLASRGAAPHAIAAIAWLALRAALEDRTLRRELAGYEAYAARVRWRLVPRVW
jgi:protein-S-isoprenylcysteine O-methyltransferase Ste14